MDATVSRIPWILGLAAWMLLPACGDGGDPAPELRVEITSHQDRAQVSGVIELAGRASAGPVEVAVDAGPWRTAEGVEEWRITLDADAWGYGYHTIQARVLAGGSQALDRISLFCTTQPPPPAAPPPAPRLPLPDPDTGLLAHWTMDSLTGARIPDAAPLGLDGTAYGDALETVGPRNGALRFDGVDDTVYIPDREGPPPAEIGALSTGTLAFWFRYDGIDNAGATAEILPLLYYGADEDSTLNRPGYDCVTVYIAHGDLFLPARRFIYFTVLKDQRVEFCFDSGPLALEKNRWYHFAVVMENGGHHAYLDGEELTLHYTQGSPDVGGMFFSHVDDPDLLALGYGLFGVSGKWWRLNGALDDVRIYDRTLTPPEVQALAEAGP